MVANLGCWGLEFRVLMFLPEIRVLQTKEISRFLGSSCFNSCESEYGLLPIKWHRILRLFL